MRGERRLAAGLALLALAASGAVATGWLRPADVIGTTIGALYQISTPDLSDPAMVRRGAAHYDRVCARCHGSPDRPDRGRALDLRPPAPTLHLQLVGWPPEALFRIVRDGVPGSAMPAWPAPGREDEVWSLVALLAVLPGMGAAEYRTQAGAPAADPALPPVVQGCAQCHGADGRGQAPVPAAFPRIDIQTEAYLRDALTAFRDRRRGSGIMQAAASGLTDAEIADAARHYAAPATTPMTDEPPPLIARGDAARKIAACAACHGPPAPQRDAIPRLAGQHADYLARQLRLFAAEEFQRGGGPLIALMTHASRGLDDGDVQPLADWYAAQPGR